MNMKEAKTELTPQDVAQQILDHEDLQDVVGGDLRSALSQFTSTPNDATTQGVLEATIDKELASTFGVTTRQRDFLNERLQEIKKLLT
jgi:hypothetical protein